MNQNDKLIVTFSGGTFLPGIASKRGASLKENNSLQERFFFFFGGGGGGEGGRGGSKFFHSRVAPILELVKSFL